ncbi:pyridoxamine 5'-phosphate oxidase family protein [Streptomyces sp. NPDC005227]|uniref:pyridoxamine 5'-phosphate oxidase family protein n=1 Tax=Streptomyces sp. NPDC005227 TaxID=3364707 RepID=UPI0036A8E90F
MRNSRSHPASYHDGELAAQGRAGFRESADHLRPIISETLPRGADGFLADLRLLVVGAAASDGRMWASMLYGQPGFLRVLGPRELSIGARLPDADPLAAALAAPALVGTVAVDLPNRRRLRINGRTTPVPDGLRLTVDQAYGNCPKYIQRREPRTAVPTGSTPRVAASSELLPEQRRMIDTADTFFIASAASAGDADASHRGGNPGFVRTPSPQRVRWPDYEGNSMLMTLGNLTVNPAASLLFVDWQAGTTLHMTGTAEIDWSARAAAGMPGAERTVDFQVAEVVQIDHPHGALIWSAPQYSRFNPPVAPAPPTSGR